ncbi:MAG: Asp23/Gls24 family envelope stress response protein [Anaerolineales bacterium]|jgi:uncharacterized alkaline shock family protein YloU|nr:Asp23/Gls24 family envelope stress response protein [Anaerolineales bacterium]
MTEQGYGSQGKTTVASDVLLTIARLSTLGVPGVSRLGVVPSNATRVLKGGHVGEGIAIDIEDGLVLADIYVVMQSDLNVQNVARKIQAEVSRAISEMVGMAAGAINIHIVDIDYPVEPEA